MVRSTDFGASSTGGDGGWRRFQGLPPIRSQINQHIADIHIRSFGGSAIEFWHKKKQSNIYSVLTLIWFLLRRRKHFVERLFSVCGMLTVERCNRMDKSLNMGAWLKVNHDDSLVDMGM